MCFCSGLYLYFYFVYFCSELQAAFINANPYFCCGSNYAGFYKTHGLQGAHQTDWLSFL